MPKNSSLLKHGSFLSLLTLLSRILGLIREMTKAALLGTSALSDAFSVAFMIPNLFRRLFAEGSIAAAFIPTFKSYLIDNDEQKTKDFLSAFFTFLSFFVSLTCGIGIILSPLLIRIFGFNSPDVFSETVFLTRFMFPFLAFISIAAFFQGILNSIKVFTPSGFAPVLLNVITIGCAWLLKDFTKNPARAMAIGIIAGGFMEAAIQLPFVIKNGFFFFFVNLKKAVTNPGTKRVLKLILPTIIGMAAYQLNDLVSTALAGNAGEGIVSSLQYSLRLQELLLGVFAVTIGTVLLPDLSEHAKKQDWDLFNKRMSGALAIIALLMIPVTFFSLTEGEVLIRLLFQNKTFDDNSVRLTLEAFNAHICGLYFIALNRVLAPAFYAQHDSKSPTIAGIVSFAVNMGLAAVLSRYLRGFGIAAALSISSAVNTILLFIFLKKKSSGQTIKIKTVIVSNLLYAVKIIIFSAAASAAVIIIKMIIAAKLNIFFSFVTAVFVFALAGILLLAVTKDKNLSALFKTIKKQKN